MVAAVNQYRCREVAQLLRKVSMPQPKEDLPALPFSRAQEANFWFFLAAICHQTSPIGQPTLSGKIDGEMKRGWDFLLLTFRAAAIDDTDWLSPQRWAECSGNDLQSMMGTLLNRPERRARLVRNLASGLAVQDWSSVIEAGHHCDFRIAANVGSQICKAAGKASHSNLLDVLAEFEAFSDPVQKKSAFFLALMKNAGLWSYRDERQLPAPVDYHEIRGHLRIGTVVVVEEVQKQIANNTTISAAQDTKIRWAVRSAIQSIADQLKTPPNTLHYLFWNLFRVYCQRDTPKCRGGLFPALPPVYQRVLQETGGCQCPLFAVCQSADLAKVFNEPNVNTEFY